MEGLFGEKLVRLVKHTEEETAAYKEAMDRYNEEVANGNTSQKPEEM